MKVTYLKLVNVAGLVTGSNKETLEIDFSKSKNRIVAIIAGNAKGKSVLLSSITPFAGVTSIDERSTLSYIVHGKNGYKEIHYQDGNDQFIIKHYYKATDKSHTVKSYFTMNGEELNENGNVRSFLSLVEIHMGLTPDMMRLIRLGTNVSSIISLAPAARKEYIGKLIDEIDAYLKIHKDINDEIRVVKTLISSNNVNLYNCHISDPLLEDEKLSQLARDISKREKEKEKLISRLANIKSLISSNNIDELKKKKHEAEASLEEFAKTESDIRSQKLDDVTIDQLITKRSDLLSTKVDVQSKINSYRLSIDAALKNIERLEAAVHKIASNNDVQSLMTAIGNLRNSIDQTNSVIKSFTPPENVTSETVYQMITSLSSFNMISQTIHSFGTKPTAVYLRLHRDGVNVDKWLKEQGRKALSRIKDSDLQALYDVVFQDDDIITPNCDTQFEGCPYYRFAEAIDRIKNKMDEESYDSETLRYIQVISQNVDNMLNETDRMLTSGIPDSLKEHLKEKTILDRLGNKLPFFDLTAFQEYLTVLRERELYVENMERLKEYEHQLSIYKKSGIDSQMDQITELKDNITFYRNNIAALNGQVDSLNIQLSLIDKQITLVSRFNDSKKYKKIFETTLESTTKILEPLESAEREKMEVEFSLTQVNNLINMARESHRQLETKINEYNRLVKEGEELSTKFDELNIILKAVSTKKGIPIIYMKRYLGKIKNFANTLLDLIYGGSFKLAKFHVTEDAFEIPYIKNGTKVPDVKYASQSEFEMSTMALSFALANRASGRYNIPLLDEVDGGLDEDSRLAFLKMVYMQMQELKAEQAFIISQNLSQMANVPMDCIILSNTGTRSKLQNIIYE